MSLEKEQIKLRIWNNQITAVHVNTLNNLNLCVNHAAGLVCDSTETLQD